MTDFHKTLQKIIEERRANTRNVRNNIYDAARESLKEILSESALSEEQKLEKLEKLDQAINKIENDFELRRKATTLQIKPAKLNINKEHNLNTDSLFIEKEASASTQIEDKTDIDEAQNSTKTSQRIVHILNKGTYDEQRKAAKKNFFYLSLYVSLALVFIISCIALGWHFFVSKNRAKFQPEIINTQINNTISEKKFDERLINKNSKKRTSPIIIEEIKKSQYIDSNLNKNPNINVSWNQLNNPNNKSIIFANANLVDNNSKLNLSLKNYNEKQIADKYQIDVIYNDETYPIDKLSVNATELNLLMNNNKEVTLENSNFNSDKPHYFHWIFDKTKNVDLLKQSIGFKIKFKYTNNTEIVYILIKSKEAADFFNFFK